MRKVMLTVLGLVGLFLLCGSAVLLAQTDTTSPVGTTVGQDATDTRLQGPSGATRGGTSGTEASTGTGQQTTDGTGARQAELSQSVLQLQQELAQVRQEVAQLRAQLDSLTANMGVGGSGQAGVAPSGAQAGTSSTQASPADGASQGTVAGGTPAGTPLRAGTAQETGARGTPQSGEAVVNAIYTGTVRSVSKGRLVLLDDEGQPFTVELSERTRVLRNGQRISVQELKQGTRVRATVDMLSGRNQATEVRTLPAG